MSSSVVVVSKRQGDQQRRINNPRLKNSITIKKTQIKLFCQAIQIFTINHVVRLP